jgi:hypothetical protein
MAYNGVDDPYTEDVNGILTEFWDPGPIVLNVVPGGVIDIAQNANGEITTCSFTGCNSVTGAHSSECYCPLRGIEVKEYPDVILPVTLRAIFHFGEGTLKIHMSETVAQSLVDLTKIKIFNNTSSGGIALQSATILGETGPVVTVKFIESQRIELIKLAGTLGGDGTPLILQVLNGAFSDLGRNQQESVTLQGAEAIEEIPDLLGPKVLKAHLFFSNGTMVLYGDETIDASVSSKVNMSNIFIANDGSDFQLPIIGGVPTLEQTMQLQVSLPAQLVGKAIKISQTFDGGSVVLNLLASAIEDLSGNKNGELTAIQVVEYPDTEPPLVVGATIDYSNSLLILACNEVMDGTRVHLANGTKFIVSKVSDPTWRTRLVGSTMEILGDSQSITFKIPEHLRLYLQANSKLATGDDGDQYYLIVEQGAVLDLSSNGNVENKNLTLPELPDRRRPAFTGATIDLGSGNVTFIADETLDFANISKMVNLNSFYISNGPGQKNISMGDAIILSSGGNQFRVQINDLKRVEAIQMSNRSGGDGTPLVADVVAEAVYDIVGNNNTANFGVPVQEVADTRSPVIVNVTIDYNDGRVTVEADEILDLTPTTKVDGAQMFVGYSESNMRNEDTSVSTKVRAPLVENLIQNAGTTTVTRVIPLEGGIDVVPSADGYVATFVLPEAARVVALQYSAQVGGWFNPPQNPTVFEIRPGAFLDVAQVANALARFDATVETPDTTAPFIIGASINYGTGILTITGSETINADPTYVGRKSAQFEARGIDLSLIFLYNYGASEPFVFSSDKTDATIEGTKIYLSGNSFDGAVNDNFVAGAPWSATVTPARSVSVQVQLTNMQRIAALRMSGTPGGDGSALRLAAVRRDCPPAYVNPNVSCANSSAIRDMAGNENTGTASLAIALNETADKVRPLLDTAGATHSEVTPALNYITGVLYLIFNEPIDATPASNVDLSKITVADRNNENARAITGVIRELDRNTLQIATDVATMQHALTILDEAEAVESLVLKPIMLNFYDGFVKDLAGNANADLFEVELVDHNNSRGVPSVKSITFTSITAGYFKELKFFGQKRLKKDEVKFVDFETSSNGECDSATARGGLQVRPDNAQNLANGVITPPYSGLDVAFTEVSPENKPFRMCYNFYFSKDEGYQLIDAVFVTVRDIKRVDVNVGETSVAVVGSPKTFTFIGNNTLPGDTVKWVSGLASEDADCNNGSQYDSPLGAPIGDRVAGSILNVTQYLKYTIYNTQNYNVNVTLQNITNVTVNGTTSLLVTNYTATQVKNMTTATPFLQGGDQLMFTQRSPDNSPYIMCYRFAGEPFKLYKNFRLTVADISAISVDVGDSDAAVVDFQKTLVFSGTNIKSGDEIRFITASTTESSQCNTSAPEGGLVGPKVNSGILDVTGPSGVGSNVVTFTSRSNAGSPFRICYKFLGEPYTMLKSFTFDVRDIVHLEASVGNPTEIVQDFEKQLRFFGTGMKAGDVVKYVSPGSSLDSDCDSFSQNITSLAINGSLVLEGGFLGRNNKFDGKVEDRSSIDITFLVSSQIYPWKLCYKFENEPFKLFSRHTIFAKVITGMKSSSGSEHVAIADSSTPKSWNFIGYGLQEGDQLKWVPNGVVSNAGCGIGDANAQSMTGSAIKNNVMTLRTYANVGLVASIPESMNFRAASPEGEPYKLCYKFADEPFKLYSQLYLNSLRVTSVNVNIGSPLLITAGLVKTYYFAGTGVNENDRFKYVPATVSVDSECGLGCENAHPMMGPDSVNACEGVVKMTGARVGFTKASDEDHALKLCYRFGSDNYKLYSDFRLFVAAVSAIRVEFGDSAVAVVDVPKVFTFEGTGVAISAVEDQAKYVSSAEVITSEDCSDAISPLREGAYNIFVRGDRSIALNFKSQTPRDYPLVLCYKFGTEGYVLMKEFQITVKDLTSYEGARALSNAPRAVKFFGNHVSDYIFGLGGEGAGVADTAKWVVADKPCSATAALSSAVGTVARKACASEYECSLEPSGDASFIFADVAETTKLVLCYRFATEPYKQFQNISLEVTMPNITGISSQTVVVHAAKTIRLQGTLGITLNDVLKFVPFGAKDCTAENEMGDEDELSANNTAPVVYGKDGYLEKQTVLFLSKTPSSGQALKLCYKFGAGPFVLFPGIKIYGKHLTGVTMLNTGNSEVILGSQTSFLFSGSGVRDGDIAKWVPPSAQTDVDCLTAGDEFASASVEEAVAQFRFAKQIDNAKLCYQFTGELFKLYSDISIVTEGEEIVEEYANKRAVVTLKLNGDLDNIPAGSPERSNFEISFKTDVAKAVGIGLERVIIVEIKRGSIVVIFTVEPVAIGESGILAQQAASLIDQQVKDPNSILLSGNVTSAIDTTVENPIIEIKPLTDEEVQNLTVAAAATTSSVLPTATSISVTPYQVGGLFSFSQAEYIAAENQQYVEITVARAHGAKGRVPVDYKTQDGTASSPADYTPAAGVLVFNDGETEKNFKVQIKNDNVRESHVETVILSLNVVGGSVGVKAGRLSSATLKIYDFMDGRSLISDNFGLESGSTNNTMGWTVVGNGKNPAWIDTNGLYSVDQLFADKEYDPACDYAATSPCGHSCSYGGGFATSGDGEGYGSGVLHLEGNGWVASTGPVEDFPDREITVSMWVRSSGAPLTYVNDGMHATVPEGNQGVVFSYEIPAARGKSGHGAHELSIALGSLPTSGVEVVIRGKNTKNREMGEHTGIKVNDGEWHFLAVTWRSAGGEIVVFKDGVRAYTGGPYRAEISLEAKGSVVLGQLQKLNVPCFDSLSCDFEQHGNYYGDIQNVRIWSTARSQRQIHLGQQWPFTALRLGLVMYWRFTDISSSNVTDLGGDGHDFSGKRSQHPSSSIVDGSPSAHPNYPCGNVHHNIWHFSAPKRFLNQLPYAYDGRLQFSLFAASYTGTARSTRGSIELSDGIGNRFSYDLKGFQPPSSKLWTGYSVILREDFGWVKEPLGTPATFSELNSALNNASKLLIRGDAWQYSRIGYGQEAVYLNNVTVIEREAVV